MLCSAKRYDGRSFKKGVSKLKGVCLDWRHGKSASVALIMTITRSPFFGFMSLTERDVITEASVPALVLTTISETTGPWTISLTWGGHLESKGYPGREIVHVFTGRGLFQEISGENGIPVTPSERSHNVGRSDVATTAAPDVDPRDPTCEVAERDRSQQIAPDHYNGQREHGNLMRNQRSSPRLSCYITSS